MSGDETGKPEPTAEATTSPEPIPLDLTEVAAEAEASRAPAPKVSYLQTVGPGRKLDEWTRWGLAWGLLLILGLLVLGAGLFVATDPSSEKAIESFLKLVFAPLVGLVGSVIGFYFGVHKSEAGR